MTYFEKITMDKEEIAKKNNSTDLEAGFQILDDFARFDQKNDVFRRAWWDESIKSKKTKLFYATYREPLKTCLLYTSPSPRDLSTSRMPSSA